MSNTVIQSSSDKAPAAGDEREERALVPPVDVVEDSAGITLYADLPGVSRERLHLHVEGDTLTIEGELSLPVPQDMKPVHAEVQQSRYRRTFALSKELDAGRIGAELSQGQLRVRIPKTEQAQPRRIDVHAA